MTRTPAIILAVALGAVAAPAFATKSCDELKTEIAAKLDEKKVANYTLDIVDADKAGDAKVVGSCEGGKKKITYSKK
jgi:predicted lipoprotein with Yx(FWY)xxD motif